LLRDFGKNVAKKRKEVDADTVHDRGELLARIGRYQEGFPLLKQATELDPSNPEYWNDLGVTYGRLGKEKDQLVAYDRALEIDPNYGLVLANKCSYFSKGHDWESALFWARRALPHLGKWPSRQMEITSFISATEKHLATLAKK
jgi:tetratricopeptide (TPR) repeat protein